MAGAAGRSEAGELRGSITLHCSALLRVAPRAPAAPQGASGAGAARQLRGCFALGPAQPGLLARRAAGVTRGAPGRTFTERENPAINRSPWGLRAAETGWAAGTAGQRVPSAEMQ